MDDDMALAIAAMVKPLHESQTRLLVAATIYASFFYTTMSGRSDWALDGGKRKHEMQTAIAIADELIAASKP